MAKRLRALRIGQIDYTNVWPVHHYFPMDAFGDSLEMSVQVPSELNRRMQEGSVDIAPISSFAYAQSYEHCLLLPDLSVSAYGPVKSILLFYKGSIDRVRNGRIALSSSSATSVNLLKIILEKFYGGSPEYTFAAPSLHDMMKGMDAALLIGDDAIRASWTVHGYEVMDLGAEWTRLTGCWMSYAIWVVQKKASKDAPGLIAQVHSALIESKRKGLEDLNGIISAAVERIGGTPDFWRLYFSGLSHDFSDDQKKGLKLYYTYAAEMGLLQSDIPLLMWNDSKKLQVNE